MRKPFIEKLTELAKKDSTVHLIFGDVGFSFMEPFMERFPKQWTNAGIAEANMLSMAAGMAQEGIKPYVYTMSNFILLRPHEQLRNDICFAKANVKLFAVKGGESYKFLGMSHNLFEGEEKAILSTLPNIACYHPGSEDRVKALMEIEYQCNGPAYFSI